MGWAKIGWPFRPLRLVGDVFMKEDMKNKVKESVSRVLLIVFFIMLLLSFFLMCRAGDWVLIYAFLGILPVISLLLGVEKHRKIACVGIIIILSLMAADHIAAQNFQRH